MHTSKRTCETCVAATAADADYLAAEMAEIDSLPMGQRSDEISRRSKAWADAVARLVLSVRTLTATRFNLG